MIWFIILLVVIAALAFRVVACIRKSKQSGEEWNLSEKYAANEFGYGISPDASPTDATIYPFP